MNYHELLLESAATTGTWSCLGLDPVATALPISGTTPGAAVRDFVVSVLERMRRRSVSPAAFKPNIGFYHAIDRPHRGDFSGSQALATIIQAIRAEFPGVPVILDAKRGDISTSSANYATEAFDCWGADAVTVQPYMGADSLSAFLAYPDRGVYTLVRTSNPSAATLQAQQLDDRRSVSEVIADSIGEHAAQFPGLGAVIGATAPAELDRLTKRLGPVPVLIPGVGSQGGNASQVRAALTAAKFPLALARVNSSRGVLQPWLATGESAPAATSDWADATVDRLIRLNLELGYPDAHSAPFNPEHA